ncbi:MAG: MFS transporter [Candidatus Korarchaeum sp.]|nr:MFS transporter [Candidatus Korarchaeum sp.]MDW8034978.1 MFS transporter [Candidatus Korarchaeum sp.]
MNDKREILHVLSVTTLASLLTGINSRILVIGTPELTHSLGADVEQVLWFTQAYMLGSTAAQLVVGRLSDLYGRVKLFSLGFAVFSLSALLCGFSSNPLQLILLRLIQGIGAAALMSLSITIITDAVPIDQLGTWIGVNQVVFRVGSLFGLTLGGFLLDYMDWRWLFWIYVPIGIASVFWSKIRLKEKYKPVERPRIDSIGFITFTSSISLILLSLTLAVYGYSYLRTSFLLALLGLLLLPLFVYWEMKFPSPALDLKLFNKWQFTSGIIAHFLHFLAFGSVSVLLVIYLSVVRGYSASATGMLLFPLELAFLVFGVLGGKLSDSYGYAPITLFGLALASASLYSMSLFSIQTPLQLIVASMILLGCGTGLFVTPNASSIMISSPVERRGVASSMRSLSFNIGFTLSLNICMLVMTRFIPYDLASRLISADGSTVVFGETEALARALRETFKVQSFIMASAMIFSVSRLPVRNFRRTLSFTSLRTSKPLGIGASEDRRYSHPRS